MRVGDIIICIDQSSERYLQIGEIVNIGNHHIDTVEIRYSGFNESEEILSKEIAGRYKKLKTEYEV